MGQDFQTIVYDVNQGVATIKLNRPWAYNAFTKEMNREITKALKLSSKNEDVRCIVITGEGKAFCSGQDLQDVDEKTNHADFLRSRYHPMLKTLKEIDLPVVAAVNGTAAGAGLSLALACDFRLVKSGTKFMSAFMGVGLVPDSGMMYVLPRIVGYAKSMEIVTLNKPITSDEAHKLGLVTELIEPDEWGEKTSAFAKQLANLPTKAFSLVKRYMMDSMHESYEEFLDKEAQAQRIAGQSEDHQEGLQSFKDKRKPHFIGK
ncbi:enoyl-CoA hydratase/isomerase family protein [Aquisalibacillus elongatus]|uniref:2-(1,2-epoxy-1,2-dihydrophenyl)acetyl-CoA isomerase n=1 Tax=Aquisalibacillus elongatus TaxID=485577 RepID=A0A3N5BF33_9BACI|nr:enoyl-CoA hydratase-related protein [Aquisalibacillus elongatus]RPF53900.1 2-(1,2-epoxy-1,2-dihydrophenyl)acetyl-CoA isomerase [Aquisalibacillus elongatus]